MKLFSAIGVVGLVLSVTGCPRDAPRTQRVQTLPAFRALPVEVTVKQRSTVSVPESEGRYRITIDDVTGGQVAVSLAGPDGAVVLPATSMKKGDSLSLVIGEEKYRLSLVELNNALIGEDFARIEITGDAAAELPEEEQIEKLLAHLEGAADTVFIRNGVEYTGKEAADHLRSKWKAAGTRFSTPEEFIEHIASKSSLTDEPYQVRLPDGKLVHASHYLRKLVSETHEVGSGARK